MLAAYTLEASTDVCTDRCGVASLDEAGNAVSISPVIESKPVFAAATCELPIRPALAEVATPPLVIGALRRESAPVLEDRCQLPEDLSGNGGRF